MLNERNTLLEDDGIEEEILVEEECSVAQAVWGDIQGNIENQTDLKNALDAKQDSLTEAQLNAVNSGITSDKVANYDGYADQIASKADQSALNAETIARGEADTALGTRIDNEALARQQADNGLQSQIDAITSKSDVVDVVANYAALQAYDTSSLGNNDVIKVLDDETHEDALTYYRWSTTTQTWTYIGQEAPYYSKGQMDVMLQGKQDTLTAGANIQIQNGTISATDTKYTAGNGLNLNGTEFSADTDVLATKEDLENHYTKTEADNLLAPKLEAEVVTELPTTGAEGKLYLTPKAHTTSTATGNPIEATVTEQAGQLESFQLDGDTFQQTYTGKNLFDGQNPDVRMNYIINDSGNEATDSTGGYTRNYSKVLPETQYILSGLVNAGTRRIYYYDNSKNFISRSNSFEGASTITFTTPANCYYVNVQIYTRTDTDTEMAKWQIEAGSQATSYEPYVGGTPSPNPDYPQPIQTVTGLQTISINGTDYPLDLGDIELCKIVGFGSSIYRDTIYKNLTDNKWYLHKEVRKYTFNGSEAWKQSGRTTTDMYVGVLGIVSLGITADESRNKSLANRAIIVATSTVGTFSIFNISSGVSQYMCYAVSSSYASSLTQFKGKLATDNLIVYAPLAAPTDTEITDTTLIAQLEAIRTASLQNGANTITNTAADSNLAGDMEISYYGYNPRNRYDKWLWLDINNEYEQIGS